MSKFVGLSVDLAGGLEDNIWTYQLETSDAKEAMIALICNFEPNNDRDNILAELDGEEFQKVRDGGLKAWGDGCLYIIVPVK